AHGDGEERGEDRRHSGYREEEVAEERTQDHQLAVGEVDDVHDAPDEGQAERRDAVDASHQEAVDEGLNEDGRSAEQRLSACPSRLASDRRTVPGSRTGLARPLPTFPSATAWSASGSPAGARSADRS